jgi:hypothetical protein
MFSQDNNCIEREAAGGRDRSAVGDLDEHCRDELPDSSRKMNWLAPCNNPKRRPTMLKDLSGVGALQDALTTTNALLAAVLAELKETNTERLDEIAKELRSLNESVGKIPFTG